MLSSSFNINNYLYKKSFIVLIFLTVEIIYSFNMFIKKVEVQIWVTLRGRLIKIYIIVLYKDKYPKVKKYCKGVNMWFFFFSRIWDLLKEKIIIRL